MFIVKFAFWFIFLRKMPRVWIKEALAKKGNKFKIDDVCFSASVSDLKGKLSESSGIDKQLQGMTRESRRSG